MKENRAQIMQWLAQYEGGLVDHPSDPGGRTNRGVTQRVYDGFRRSRGLAIRPVDHLTDEEHDAIYLAQYWRPIMGDDLPAGIDASVFDMAVHSGVSRAVKTLQQVLGVAADGIMGQITLAAVLRAAGSGKAAPVIVDYNDRRMAFLRRLKTFKTFGRGWTRRVMGDRPGVQTDDMGIVDRSIRLARGNTNIPLPKTPAPGKATGRDVKWLAAIIDALGGLFAALLRRTGKGGQ